MCRLLHICHSIVFMSKSLYFWSVYGRGVYIIYSSRAFFWVGFAQILSRQSVFSIGNCLFFKQSRRLPRFQSIFIVCLRFVQYHYSLEYIEALATPDHKKTANSPPIPQMISRDCFSRFDDALDECCINVTNFSNF